MYPVLSLGPLVIPTAGLVYIIGAWVTLSVVERAARALDLDAESTYGVAAVAVAAGFIGARLVFVALHWTAYRENLSGIVWPLTSGYSLWGGLFFALAAAFFYGRRKQLAIASTLDALAPGLLAGFLVISLADFLGGPGYGTITALPFGIDVFGIRRHPVQLYEILVGVAALLTWGWSLRRRKFDGQLFLLTIAVYSGGRLFVDAFRANAWLTPGGFHIFQIISLVVLLVCVFLLGRNLSRSNVAESKSLEA
jgi:phosphatidylglycerol:prolipoprotein diacylglycerol transferase